jgi:hypothetical protein
LTASCLVHCGKSKGTANNDSSTTHELSLSGATSCSVKKFKASTLLGLTDTNEYPTSVNGNVDLAPKILAALGERIPSWIHATVSQQTEEPRLSDSRIPIEFRWKDHPLCSSQFYATAHLSGSTVRIKGRFPSDLIKNDATMPALDLPSLASSIEEQARIHEVEIPESVRIGNVEQCWYATDQKLQPAVHVFLKIDGVPHEGTIVEHKFVELFELSLHATAKIYTYPVNSLQPISELTVEGMQAGGYLCNDYFIADTDGVQKAQSSNGVFQFKVGESPFLESSLFVHANDMLRWFQKFDLNAHWSQAQVELRLSYLKTYSNFGPSYENPQSYGDARGPVIVVPNELVTVDGEVLLKNLATDFDVVAHELGHHIVTRYLPIKKSPDLVAVHEGLADFFVYARTGDGCLGETICTDNDICEVKNQCLRSAELPYRADFDPKAPAHTKSQALSGMLWDLATKRQLGLENTTKLVFASLKHLDKNTNFDDVYTELLQADVELFKGVNKCAITAAAKDRGISAALVKGACF